MILVVGEAPSRFMHERNVTTPMVLAVHDLARLSGMGIYQWLKLFEVRNLLNEWPGRGPNGKNDLFPLVEAQVAARQMDLAKWPKVILMGRRVAAAFGYDHDWFNWVWFRGTLTAVAPHPSHASRWWNDRNNVARAEEFWHATAHLER